MSKTYTVVKTDQKAPPITCQACGKELPFLEYRQKVGKNGKMAKWPAYGRCYNPECSTGRKNLGKENLVEIPEWNIPENQHTGILQQTLARAKNNFVEDMFAELVDLANKERFQPGAITILLSPYEYGQVCEILEFPDYEYSFVSEHGKHLARFQETAYLTPKYRYFWILDQTERDLS